MRLRLKTLAASLACAAMITGGMTGSEPGHAEAASSTAPSPPSAVRRLSEAQYRNSVSDIFGADIKIVGRFEPDLRVDGLLAVGSTAVSVGPAGFEQYEIIARSIAGQVTDKQHRDKLVGCAPQASDKSREACARSFVEETGLRLFRRPLPARELEALATAAVDAGARLGDFHEGLATVLAGMLSDPRFLFRIDVPAAKGSSIDGYSKASRLSYLLWNSTPDEALLDAARKGELDNEEGLARAVDRLIASPRFNFGVRAFFSDFLHLDDVDTLSKDALIFPAFNATVANASREQTLRTITDLLVDRGGDYRELFTTRRFAMTRVLGPIYDIPIDRDGWYFHEFPEGDSRAGLFSQVSLLALHSHPGRSSPTLRGMAIRQTLLCQKVPSPPANVNFAVLQDVNNPDLKTTRARLQAHLEDPVCAGCHKLTDPIGLGLEQFDGAGQFRLRENGEKIDVASQFGRIPFTGAAGLGTVFRDTPAASSCLVNSVWRYANGRQVAPSDADWVDALDRKFSGARYNVPALFRAIALDPAYYAITPRITPKARVAMLNRGESR